MTSIEKFNETVSILVNAYLNDELEHKVCSACAVGNIVAYHMGTKPKRLKEPVNVPFLDDKFIKLRFDNNHFENGSFAMGWYRHIDFNDDDGARQIKATGYSKDEIRQIEFAFESASMGNSMDDWMFNGLMAVCDVLAEIHGIDLQQKESAKLMFVK